MTGHISQTDPERCQMSDDMPDSRPPGAYRVRMNLYRSTWHWFTTNPQGGGFGSSHCGTKRHTLATATVNIPAGASYQLIVNERDCGTFTK